MTKRGYHHGNLRQALVEAALRHDVGVEVRLGDDPFVDLFAESAARAVVTTTDDRVDALLSMAGALGVPAAVIGRTGGETLEVRGLFAIGLPELREAWTATLPAALGR